MAKSLEKMDKAELQDELKQRKKAVREVEKAIDQYDDMRKKEAREKLEATAAELGYSVDELLGNARGSKPRTKGAPKYRHPENPSKTWTGKGRQPVWYKEHVDAGGDPAELAI